MTSFFTVGSIVAAVVSWSVNESILWAIVHSFCSWIYLGYYSGRNMGWF